jgi:hypothetical protein
VAVATAGLIALLAVQAQGVAVAHLTLNLPLLSSQPCITALAPIPGLLGAVAMRRLRRSVSLD